MVARWVFLKKTAAKANGVEDIILPKSPGSHRG
jgi:hypothetical protein